MGPSPGLTDAVAVCAALILAGAGMAAWRGTRVPRGAGPHGEWAAADALGRQDDIVTLRGVRLAQGGRRAEIDLLLIGRGALLVVEAKNLSGRLVPGPGDWLYEGPSGPRFMQAPTRQAARQARLLRGQLRALRSPWASWPIGACVVLTGRGTLAEGPLPADVPVLRLPDLRAYALRYFADAAPAGGGGEEAGLEERRAWAARLAARSATGVGDGRS